MRICLAITLDLDRAEKPAEEYREVDIPGTQSERLPDDFGPDARTPRIGFSAAN